LSTENGVLQDCCRNAAGMLQRRGRTAVLLMTVDHTLKCL